ncbi:MAG: EAL domain-containing protein [Rickettsiales bacterium]
MPESQQKIFNIPYLQYDNYWLNLFSKSGALNSDIANKLQGIGYHKEKDGRWVAQTTHKWAELWAKTYSILQKNQLTSAIEVALTTQEEIHNDEELKKASSIQNIAENLWLGEALKEDRIMCYLQPIVTDKKQRFGFESFVRASSADGKIINGGDIVKASKILNIEHIIDRHLHVQAVQTFASGKCLGFLFVNFFPGFIHRPSVYLEGLGQAAKMFSIIPKNLVLEFTRCESKHDLKHVKSVCEYALSQGYSVALDDITTFDNAKKLIQEIRPDFVKLDIQELGGISNPDTRTTINQINTLAKNTGCTVIAEGVETEEEYNELKHLNITLFQGYYFAPPSPIDKL